MLAVTPIVDKGQYLHKTDPKDRIIENLKADVRIKNAEIAKLVKTLQARFEKFDLSSEEGIAKLHRYADHYAEWEKSEVDSVIAQYEQQMGM